MPAGLPSRAVSKRYSPDAPEDSLSTALDFPRAFATLTGHSPLPWQKALYHEFVAGRVPATAELPTGLGKSLSIACWLLALAEAPDRVPRRLVYIVNRRTVVDQATNVVERLREQLIYADIADRLAALCGLTHEYPLGISTLRGEFADNAEWRRDPSRPAIVVGTVDMIGSRLLFSGYGAGYRTRPLLAGFLGQDTLIVHDEAHLEPAFQQLLESIEREQRRSGDSWPLRLMALTATPRSAAATTSFTLTPKDHEHDLVRKRLHAVKSLRLHRTEEKRAAAAMSDIALQHAESGTAVLIFTGTINGVTAIRSRLLAAGVPESNIATLTGTMRGHERDLQLDPVRPGSDPAFARFIRRVVSAEPPLPGTVYLVATSAGEVGVDMSADHMVSDLSSFESMTQRLGRVNRYGDTDACVDVVISDAQLDGDVGEVYRRTLELLEQLDGDASPAALARLDAARRLAAFSPAPAVLPVTDILFDAWSMTTLRSKLPNRPEVADYLHGLSPQPDAARTYVAWRREVDRLDEEALLRHQPADLLHDYPLKPHEYLSDRTDRIMRDLGDLAKRRPESRVWIVEPDAKVRPMSLHKAAELSFRDLAYRFVILGPAAGGLRRGMLDPAAEPTGDESEDVADLWNDRHGQRRRRVFEGEEQAVELPARMRLIRRIVLAAPDPDTEPGPAWLWYVRSGAADETSSTAARTVQEWQQHTDAVRSVAGSIAARLLSPKLARAVDLAALAHDLGKRRELWQRSIGNREYPSLMWAKQPRGADTLKHNYRHELGSLADINADAAFPADVDTPVRELVMHLVAAHHGRARPCFLTAEQHDPERPDEIVGRICGRVPERFGRLQHTYGRWGLAYIESILRAADYIASEDA